MFKKVLILIMLFFSLVFAENYIVASVDGKAECFRNGLWIQIVEDDVLTDSTEIKISVNSSVTLIANGKTYVLRNCSKEKVSENIIRSCIRFGTEKVESKIIKKEE